MKKTLILLTALFSINSFSQEKKLKEYSHTEFFKLIKAEKDSVFKLSDAIIRFTDQDSLFLYRKIKDEFVFGKKDSVVVNKHIDLVNVHFEHQYDLSEFGYSDDKGIAIPYVIFNKDVSISYTSSIVFYGCVFKGALNVFSQATANDIRLYEKKYPKYESSIGVHNSKLLNNVSFFIGDNDVFSPLNLKFIGNETTSINTYLKTIISISNIDELKITDNTFKGNGVVDMYVNSVSSGLLFDTDFKDYRVHLIKISKNQAQLFQVENNTFNKPPLVSVNQFSTTDTYHWKQWQNNISSIDGYYTYLDELINTNDQLEFESLSKNDSIFNAYQTIHKYKLEESYKFEQQLLGQFYDFYKQKHDSDYANLVYVEIKNLETKRYAYLYKEGSNFNTFFKWRISQFLKVFSAYGTEPERAIVSSIYVILFFAFIYMLFPNSWEAGKKNKLMNRLQFFTKYFKQKEGIKEIYEEEKQNDIMSYKEFRDYMQNSKKEIPNFFLWLTRPIYYFSSYNYKMTGKVLRHTDILKGRWVDLPKRKKVATSFVIGIWIFFLILLDLLIKFLNALTLSINTFTTLGFGEIPMKGIPRYLTVIQGFIGWFMLTIFSVSLISQLLN